MATTQTEQIKEAPPRVDVGISFRAIQCARVIDRLRPGKHVLLIEKKDIESMDWKFIHTELEFMQKLKPGAYNIFVSEDGGIEINRSKVVHEMVLARKDGYVPE